MRPLGSFTSRAGMEGFPIFLPPFIGVERTCAAALASFASFARVPDRIERGNRQAAGGIKKVDFGIGLGITHLVEGAQMKGIDGFDLHSLAAAPARDAVEIQRRAALAIG